MNNNANTNNNKKANFLLRIFQWFKCPPFLMCVLAGYLFLLLYFIACGIHRIIVLDNPSAAINFMSLQYLVAFLLGGICLGYIAYVIYLLFAKKIERDLLMVKEKYWKYLLLLIFAIPFAFYAILLPITKPEKLYNDSTNVYLCNQCGDIQSVKDEPDRLWWIIYYYFIDPGNQHSAQGSGAKIISATLALLGIFLFNGLLVTTILGMIDRRKEGLRNGRVRYTAKDLPANQFAVVIGANEIASSVIKNLLKPKTDENTLECLSNKNNKYVILQTSSDVQKVRDVLASHLTPAELDKVIIYNALRDSELEIAHLHLEYATEIYILGENTTIDGGETYHDAMNMRCLNIVSLVLNKNDNGCNKKDCHVMFEYQTTYSVFQHSDISKRIHNVLNFFPFNRYESWARRILIDNRAKINEDEICYVPLDGYEGISPSEKTHVHLVIVGMSKMGIALGIQALHVSHYPNICKYPDQRTRVTFIDTNADKEMAFFKGRYATLFELARHRYIDANNCNKEQLNTQDECGVESNKNEYRWIDPMKDPACKWKHLSKNGKNFLDVEIEFIKGELESDGVRNYLKEISKEELNSKLTIAICLTQTHQAVAAALYMPIDMYQSANLQQVWVYQRDADDIISNLSDETIEGISMRYQKLRPFGMLYGEYMDDGSHLTKAQFINIAYQDDMILTESLLKNKKDWEDAPVAKKWSSQLSADSIYVKMRSVFNWIDYHKYLQQLDFSKCGFHAENIIIEYFINKFSANLFENEMAICEHNRWNVEKLLMFFSPCKNEQFDQFKKWVHLGTIFKGKERKWFNDLLKKEFKDLGDSLKNNRRIHRDICDMDVETKEPIILVDPFALKYDVKINNAIAKIAIEVDADKNKWLQSILIKTQKQIIESLTKCPSTNS